MRIQGLGIELISLSEKDLRQTLNWRNQEKTRAAMLYQSTIPYEDHVNWFHQLKSTDKYLLIKIGGDGVGVINVKKIDPEKKEGEAGIFIGEERVLKTTAPIASILLLMTTFFNEFNFRSLNATVRKDNYEAIELNEKLGYQIVNESLDAYTLKVNKDEYFKATETLRRVLTKQYGSTIQIDLENDEQWLTD